jgi:tellurite methyltransferase
MWDYRLDEKYDVLFSSGALHYIKPELRDEIMTNYKAHVNDGGVVMLNVFVEKPFIKAPPEKEENSFNWKSRQLFTYFHDWYIENCLEFAFNCNSSGIPHCHAMNLLYARNAKEV